VTEASRLRFGRGAGVFLLVCLLGVGLAAPPAHGQGGEGLLRLDGSALGQAALEDDAIVVFFASWSPRCRDVVARTQELHEKWGKRARVLLVAFQEGEDDVRNFLADAQTDVVVVRDVDGSFSKRHGITTLPSMLVLQRGSVAFRGGLPADVDSILKPILG
jgi:thiol-disulfide isomerase/thioredoxin